ncbi:tetratricopeptide repeat protein [Leptolyngbya sp. NIES-2104]|uniref:tetratricopeptide repeat protein n=1 Tax=Leptolyngbya sp. NIES-2104 TaxID=1552121 RepID=UPI0006EC4E22|nr:tetratricopeptide repeat protein [Leptolyngbya sp. NIES-2104]GAP99146.1 TPR repeat [Leptolyngbya sp. NIES-2104]
MSDIRKNRWLLNIVLIVATVGLLGVTMLPLITSAFTNPQANKPSPSPSEAATPQKADVEARARGYEEVLKREPENPTALRGLLEARLQLGDVKGVIDPLEKLAKLNPNQTEYGVLLAQAKQQLNDPEGAAQAYRSILQSKPGDVSALAGLSDLLIKQQRPEAAIGLLQDTIKQAPTANKSQPNSVDVTAVQVLLGKVFASQKRYDDALVAFDDAANSNANDFQPVLYKALVLKEQGKKDEAKPLFDKAISLAPAQFKDQITRLSTDQPAAQGGTTSPTTPPAGVTPTSPAPSSQASPAPVQKN